MWISMITESHRPNARLRGCFGSASLQGPGSAVATTNCPGEQPKLRTESSFTTSVNSPCQKETRFAALQTNSALMSRIGTDSLQVWTKPGHKGGFTFVEALAIILVLALIASILTPMLARARQKANQTTCTANLQRIGQALQSYAEANQDRLPGPVSPLAQASYDLNSEHQLICFLAPQLGCPKPSKDRVTAQVLLCPAAAPRASESASPVSPSSYVLNTSLKTTEGARVYPFGSPGQPESPPLKLSALAVTAPPHQTAALSDADKANVNPTLKGWGELPYKPIHGKFRNQLYFDGHVAEKPW